MFIDGIKIGETPVAAFYPPGTYPIRIVKDGYVTIENETIEITAPNTRKDYTLDENLGRLTVNTHEKATVYFNDELVENPIKVKLTPQLVKVKVTQPKADDLEQQVLLKKDDDVVLDMYPVVKTGTIQVAVTPFDAKVELTGDAGEYFTSEGMKVFEDVPIGTYKIKISANGYQSKTETKILENGDLISLTLNLQKSENIYEFGSSMDFRNELGIEMVFVEGGTFIMGCTSEQRDCNNNEKPAHDVTVDDFYMGKYEVTQKQWQEVMGSNPSYFSGCDDCPVEQVSWNDVQEFIDKLNQMTGKKYRLPTEAEWEYAARGGLKSTPTIFAGSNEINIVAWFWSNSGDSFLNGYHDYDKMEANNCKTQVVGQKQPNELGIYDMSGNVCEWCIDWEGDYDSGSKKNPQGASWGFRRIRRGGSWFNQEESCRVSDRGSGDPKVKFIDGGIRLSLSL